MVTLVFRTDDGAQWGTGKGGNLTPAEVDQNFYNLKVAVEDLGAGPAPAEIDTITLTGTQLLITLDDSREFGPYTLPRSNFKWRGDWTATTSYQGNDVVRVPTMGLYLVNYAHTSPATFDAGHVALGELEGAYIQMFDADGLVGSTGGSDVSEASDTTLTPAAGDPVHYYRCTNASGCTVTIPPESAQNFPVGSELRFARRDGAVDIAAGSGVTLNLPTGFTADAPHVGAVMTAKKVGSDEWDIFGDLASV